jgi:AcrR family transcriptional regulator
VTVESVAARGRPRSAEADERILAAAVRQLRERGYSELSLEQVAVEAGVGKATLYRRYRNKADLATTALASVSAAELAKPLPEDTRAALVTQLKRIESAMSSVGFGVIATMLDERDPELLALHRERTIRRGRERNRWILQRAQERGEIRGDADLETAIEMLVGSMFARRLSGNKKGRWPEAAVDALLQGLAR